MTKSIGDLTKTRTGFVSMRWKVVASMSAFLVIILALIGFGINYHLEGLIEAGYEKRGASVTRSVGFAVSKIPLEELQSFLDSSEAFGVSHALIKVDSRKWAFPASGAHLQEEFSTDHEFIRINNILFFTQGITLADGSGGTISLGFPVAVSKSTLTMSRWLLVGYWLILLGLGIFAAYQCGNVLARPTIEMVEQIEGLLEAGDLTTPIVFTSQDELSMLGQQFSTMRDRQYGILKAVSRSGESLGEVIYKLSESGMTVSSGAVTIQSLVRDTVCSIENMLSSLKGVRVNVDGLEESSERGAEVIVQMARSNDKIADNMQTMAAAVHQSTQAIERMASSVQETARNVGDLESAIDDTAGSMTEITKTISGVEKNAQDTVFLSHEASQFALLGLDALKATLNGIDKISNASETAFDVIRSLNETTSEIGNIVGVIKGVTDQTNLLALNASIIASQAGEYGKGFGVVADEIKNLAERTRIATAEIARLIDKIQQESLHAISAMERGIENVDQGVKLGREADEAFERILHSTDSSQKMVQDIAVSTKKQAQQTKLIAASIQRVSMTAKQITRVSIEQADGAREIKEGTRRMNALTELVHRSSTEQSQGSKQVIQAIEEINEMVGQLCTAQQKQTRSSENVLQAVQLIHEVCEDQDASVRELDQAILSLQTQTDELSGEIVKFSA
ncbi:MAG: methyl-accepting chemotaxis protein [Myxococcota bacterium]|nr:methyl-accepting chemotaxis protein [Myxococcota bacterium]